MNYKQEKHLNDIQEFFCQAVSDKYRKGQTEHGGNLWERDTVADMQGEVIDLVTYFYDIRSKFETIRRDVKLLAELVESQQSIDAEVRFLIQRLKTLTNIKNEPTAITSPGLPQVNAASCKPKAESEEF